MEDRYLFRGERIDEIYCVEVDPSTICRCIGSRDKNSKLI